MAHLFTRLSPDPRRTPPSATPSPRKTYGFARVFCLGAHYLCGWTLIAVAKYVLSE